MENNGKAPAIFVGVFSCEFAQLRTLRHTPIMLYHIRISWLCLVLTSSLALRAFAADATASALAKIALPSGAIVGSEIFARVTGEQGSSEELLPDYLISDATRLLKVRDLEIMGWETWDAQSTGAKEVAVQKSVNSRLKAAGYTVNSTQFVYPTYWHGGQWSAGFEATRRGRVLAGAWYRNAGCLLLFWGERVPQTAQRKSDDALLEAVKKGEVTQTEKMLAGGASVEARDYDGKGALHLAASGEQTPLLELLLKRGANVNARDKFGNTPLLLANDAATARTLLENKADPNLVDDDANSALILAAQRGNEEVLRLLLEAGANPNLVNENGGTALSWAAWQGTRWGYEMDGPVQYPAMVKLLLAHGAEPNLGSESGWNALTLAAQDDQAGVVPLMIAASKDKGALLRATAQHGQNKIVEKILAGDTDANAASAQGVTALMQAARSQQSRTVQLLLQRGADVTRRDRDGRNALMWACLPPLYWLTPGSVSRLEANFDYIAATFKTKGVDLEARDRHKLTALALAANHGHAVGARQLLKMGADPNTATYAGNTPLHQAVARFGVSQNQERLARDSGFGQEEDYQQVIADLIKAGVRVNARNSAGQTALTLAALHKQRDAIKTLKAAGATR